jgi:stage IV sporulation protein B
VNSGGSDTVSRFGDRTLLPLDRGIIVNVKITEIVMGRKNSPGELKGVFDRFRNGELKNNSEVGVFGKFDEIPPNIGEEIPIGFKNELQTGKAYILSTLDRASPSKFEIEIEKFIRFRTDKELYD